MVVEGSATSDLALYNPEMTDYSILQKQWPQSSDASAVTTSEFRTKDKAESILLSGETGKYPECCVSTVSGA